MSTFRVVNRRDFVASDLNDLPFWLDVRGELVWVSLRHDVVDGELVDSIAIQKVVDNVAGPIWQRYRTNDFRGLQIDLVGVIGNDRPLFTHTPKQIRDWDLTNSKPTQSYSLKRGCECEVEQGEPCYCKLK